MTHVETIKQHLDDGKAITGLDALRTFGCYRLSAVIHILRHKFEMNIVTEFVTKRGKVFAKYSLVK